MTADVAAVFPAARGPWVNQEGVISCSPAFPSLLFLLHSLLVEKDQFVLCGRKWASVKFSPRLGPTVTCGTELIPQTSVRGLPPSCVPLTPSFSSFQICSSKATFSWELSLEFREPATRLPQSVEKQIEDDSVKLSLLIKILVYT